MDTNREGEERIELRGFRYVERTEPSGHTYLVRTELSEVLYLQRSDLSGSSDFSIREHVAGIRRRYWKKCCPFELSGNNPEVDNVLSSLIQEADTQAPNASQVGNAEVHEARSENPNTDEVIGEDAAENPIIGETSAAATIREDDIAEFGQNETNVAEDAIVAENDKPQDPAVVADNAVEIINIPSDSDSDSDDAMAAEDAIAGNDLPDDGTVPNEDGSPDSFSPELEDAPGNNRRGRKPQKFRRLEDIYKELGSCIYASEEKVESESTAETSEDDSDEVTLGNFIRGRRSVRANSKRIDTLKNKRKTRQDAEPRLDKGKRVKSVSEDNRGDDSELAGSKYYLRRNRIKEFSPEDSSLSRGNKSNRETVQEDCAREVLKLLDGNQRRFTEEEENHSAGPSRGVKRARRLVDQSPTAVSIRDVETSTSSGRVHKRIRESSPPSDSEIMAVFQLLRLSMEEPERPLGLDAAPLSAADSESPLGLDAPVSAAEPESPFGLDAPVSAAEPESPLGLDGPLSVADRESPLRLDAPVSAAEPESPLGLDAPFSAADPEIPLGIDAPLSAADLESPLRLYAPLTAADSESPLGLDGVAAPALESMVSESNVEVNVIDTSAGLPCAEKAESETFVCRVSRNPAEFSIPKAKKFMRRGKAVKLT